MPATSLQEHPVSLTVFERASEVVGVPYVLNGWDPKGWDCRGLVAWCRREWDGKSSPGMDGVFPAEIATNVSEIEKLMLAQIDSWQEVPPATGSVALFSIRGRDSHVAYLLNETEFLHARDGVGTTVNSLLEKKWHRRFRGAYDLRK